MRQYTLPIASDDYIMDAIEFEKGLHEERQTGSTILPFGYDDGIGYWVKDGLISHGNIFSTPRLDATHIVWYNK